MKLLQRESTNILLRSDRVEEFAAMILKNRPQGPTIRAGSRFKLWVLRLFLMVT